MTRQPKQIECCVREPRLKDMLSDVSIHGNTGHPSAIIIQLKKQNGNTLQSANWAVSRLYISLEDNVSRIALVGENSVEYVRNLLDIWNNGNCAVLLDWRIPLTTAIHMMIEAEVTECRIDDRLLSKIAIPKDTSIKFVPYHLIDKHACCLPNDVYEKYKENYSEDEAVVIYSSGTTGNSKGVILSHYAITTNAKSIIDYTKMDNNDCTYIVKPLSHSSALTGELLISLITGASVVLGPTIVLPRHVLQQIHEFSVTMLCLNPKLLRMYSEAQARSKYDLNPLKVIYSSGSILNEQSYMYARRIFQGIDIYNVYGLSEAGPRVTAQTKCFCNTNSVGKPISGVEVIIVDEKGNVLSQGERGIIHVKTPSRYSGYVSNREAKASLYKGWLNTSDMGFIDAVGELHVVGRSDDLIFFNAHKIYPWDIERLILEDHQINDCVVEGCEINGCSRIGCLYVSLEERTFDIIHHINKSLMQHEIPTIYVRVSSIPRNRNGKVDREEVRRILRIKWRNNCDEKR